MPAKELIILTHEFPFVSSGEPWLKDEVSYLSKDWDTVQVFCEANKTETKHRDYPQVGFLPNKFNYKRYLGAFFNSAFLSAFISECRGLMKKGVLRKSIVESTSTLLRCYSIAKQFNEEYITAGKEFVIYAFWGDELTTTACLLKSMIGANAKAVCRVHGFDLYEERNKNNYVKFRQFQLSMLDGMFSVSEAGTNYLKGKYPAYVNKIHTSYLGTDKAPMNPLPGKECLELVSCAYVNSVKRHELIVETLKHITIPVRWTHIGTGANFENIKKLCASLPPNVKVDMLGYLSGKELYELYETRPFHYLISTSISEGLPVSMMEAISFGIPIIATDVGGCKEIVNQVTGHLIPRDFNPAELAKKLVELFQNYDYSAESRRRVQGEWDKKFNASKNYTAFHQTLSGLK